MPRRGGHDVELAPLDRYLMANFGVARAFALTAADWLMMDEQKLAELTTGEVFRDDLGFGRVRAGLAFYPDDLRLHILAVEWTRITDEQAFPGRAGSRGDEVGAACPGAGVPRPRRHRPAAARAADRRPATQLVVERLPLRV